MPHRRLWASLGTQSAVRVISVLMLIYLLIIGFLVVGYSRVSSCLAIYADRSAISTNARAVVAAQDRQLDLAERDLDEQDRVANRAFNKALSAVLVSLSGTDQDQKRQAYAALLVQDKKTAAQLDADATSRATLRAARLRNEDERKQHPVPPPPSQSC